MEPKIIGKKYDKIAKWWNNKHINSDYGIQQIKRAIKYCKSKNTALDVGCGSGGRVINELIKNKFNVTGIDVSENMISLAKENHPDSIFEVADICNWSSKFKFDLIIAWDSIFHLSMDKQKPVIEHLCSILNKNGILIYTFGDTIGNKEDLSFSDNLGKQIEGLRNDYFGYGSIGTNENIRILGDNKCKCMHIEFDQYPESHVFIISKKEI